MSSEDVKQAAALCFRWSGGQPEFVLVRTKGGRERWIFPKGRVKKREAAWEAALRESVEEAGKDGAACAEPFTHFRYQKSTVAAFLLKFQPPAAPPREEGRAPRWFSVKQAIRKLSENRGYKSRERLRRVLVEARAVLIHSAATRFAAKQPDEGRSRARDRVFISYSHVDREWRERLRTMFEPFCRARNIPVWDDTEIRSGDRWEDEIKKGLASAKVAVLLVSPDFLNSKYVSERELPSLLKAAEHEGLRILCVVVRHSAVNETGLGVYQAANDPSAPLDSLSPSDAEKELLSICGRICEEFASGDCPD